MQGLAGDDVVLDSTLAMRLTIVASSGSASAMAGTRGRVASTEALLKRVLRSPSYRGKHVLLVHGKVYAAASSNHLQRLYDRAVKEFPGETPTLAYVPRADALVLVLR
jgi:hypothetical protein